MNIARERPLVFIYLETTGPNPSFDRIVELSVLKVNPDGSMEERTIRINPEMPISPGATRVHGIKDEDVADQAAFSLHARNLKGFLDGCDLSEINAKRSDLPVLRSEFARAGIQLDLEGRDVIDYMAIIHKLELITDEVKEATTRWIREVFELPEAVLIPGRLGSSKDCPIANTLKAAGIVRVRVMKTRVRYGHRRDERVVLFQGKSKHFVSLFDAGFMPKLEDHGSIEDY